MKGDMGKEMEDLDYVILGDAPEITLKGEAKANPEEFVEKSLLELGQAMARYSIGEVPVMAQADFKNDQAIAAALADVEVDDPYFKDLDPITDEGITDIAALTIAKAEAEKENTADPKNKAKLTNFEHRIAEKPPRKISTRAKITRAAVASITTFLTAVACGLSPAVPSVTPEVTPQSPTTTEVTPPPTTEPTKEPTPDVFKHLEGATATPSANGKSWNIKLENGRSFEVTDPERDIKIDNFGVWKIFDKDGLLIYVFDPGIKHYDGTYTEGKGWIDAAGLSPVDASTFPKAYSEIVNDPNSSNETEQNDYQEFLDAVRLRFFNEQGIQDIVDKMEASGKIAPEQAGLWGMIYWIQQHLEEVQSKQISFVLGPKEIRDSVILESKNHFDTWLENVRLGTQYRMVGFGWRNVGILTPIPENQKLTIFGVDVPYNYPNDLFGVSGIFAGIGKVDVEPDNYQFIYALKDQKGNWMLIFRFSTFNNNFKIHNTECVVGGNGSKQLILEAPFGAVNDDFGKPLSKNDIWMGLGKEVSSHGMTAPFMNWARENPDPNIKGAIACHYPYGTNTAGAVQLSDPGVNNYTYLPWAEQKK